MRLSPQSDAASSFGRSMVHELDIRLLGGLMARVDRGASLSFPTRRSAGVFAYLGLHAGRLFHRDVLTALYWGDRPQSRARKSFRTCLWRIRSVVEGDAVPTGTFLQVVGQRVGLGGETGGTVRVDVQAFESAVTARRRPAPGDAEEERRLAEAVELYRGDFMEGSYEDWCQEERDRLRHLLHQALERLVSLYVAREEFSQAVERGRRLLRADPFRERVHRDLMTCLYRMGSRPQALRQYERCAETLRAEMDLEPMAETRELRDRIREGRLDLH